MISLDDPVRPDPDVVATELGENETVLLHLVHKNYFSLNVTGSRIWKGIQQGQTPREISRTLQDEFDVTPEHAESAVLDLLRELTGQGLVLGC